MIQANVKPLLWKAIAITSGCFNDHQCKEVAEKHLRNELPEGAVVVETGSIDLMGEGVVQLWVTYRSGNE